MAEADTSLATETVSEVVTPPAAISETNSRVWGRPFQPGQSGNPSGRPKSKPITEAYKAILADPANREALAKALLKHAKKGNVFAAKEMADRVEGKVVEQVEITANVSLELRLVEAERRLAAKREAEEISVPEPNEP